MTKVEEGPENSDSIDWGYIRSFPKEIDFKRLGIYTQEMFIIELL